MAVSEDKTRTIISLEKDLKTKLESLAKQEDRSFNNYGVKILKDYVQSLEKGDENYKEILYLLNYK